MFKKGINTRALVQVAPKHIPTNGPTTQNAVLLKDIPAKRMLMHHNPKTVLKVRFEPNLSVMNPVTNELKIANNVDTI